MIVLIIYIIGVVAAYVLAKKFLTMDGETWTVGDKRVAIITSLFSWAAVFSALINILICSDIFDSDKPAKW